MWIKSISPVCSRPLPGVQAKLGADGWRLGAGLLPLPPRRPCPAGVSPVPGSPPSSRFDVPSARGGASSVPSIVSERMWVCPTPSWALSPKALPGVDSDSGAAPGTASAATRRPLGEARWQCSRAASRSGTRPRLGQLGRHGGRDGRAASVTDTHFPRAWRREAATRCRCRRGFSPSPTWWRGSSSVGSLREGCFLVT